MSLLTLIKLKSSDDNRGRLDRVIGLCKNKEKLRNKLQSQMWALKIRHTRKQGKIKPFASSTTNGIDRAEQLHILCSDIWDRRAHK